MLLYFFGGGEHISLEYWAPSALERSANPDFPKIIGAQSGLFGIYFLP